MWIGQAEWRALNAKIDAIRSDIAAIKNAATKLSPADQAKLNTIYDTAAKDAAKIDTAQKK